MRRFQLFLLIVGTCFWIAPHRAVAQEPWGRIEAEPNPCRIEPGHNDCATFIRWETRGVQRVKLFVKAEGRNEFEEKEFSGSLRCEHHDCPANWIRPDTRYKFELYDFTRGDRGRLLASVVVHGER